MTRKITAFDKLNTWLSLQVPPYEIVLDRLAEIGQEFIDAAFESKKRGNVKYNQHDAFAFGVYYNGSLLRRGFVGEEMSTGPDRMTRTGRKIKGREEAQKMLEQFIQPDRGYCLLVTNAMYYSAIQEGQGFPILHQEMNRIYALQEELGLDGRVKIDYFTIGY